MSIVVYTKDVCVQCKYTKNKLAALGLDFTEVNIEHDNAARKLVEDSGRRELPMIVVDRGEAGKEVWHGFQYAKIKALAAELAAA